MHLWASRQSVGRRAILFAPFPPLILSLIIFRLFSDLSRALGVVAPGKSRPSNFIFICTRFTLIEPDRATAGKSPLFPPPLLFHHLEQLFWPTKEPKSLLKKLLSRTLSVWIGKAGIEIGKEQNLNDGRKLHKLYFTNGDQCRTIVCLSWAQSRNCKQS